MNSRFLVTRRCILQQVAMTVSTVAVTLPTHADMHPTCISGDPDLCAAVDELIACPNSAAIIGEVYLTQFVEERSTDMLMSKIRESLRNDTKCIGTQALLRRIREDFECGDIVNLHGWLLSRTEARVCALFTI